MFYLAVSEPPSMVKDNYYKEGKSINADLAKRRFAKALNLRANMLVEDRQVSLVFENLDIELDSALYLHFYHSTLAERDFDLTLLKDAKGHYRATFDNIDLKAKWVLSLEPFDQEWEIRQEVSLPRADWFAFFAQ